MLLGLTLTAMAQLQDDGMAPADTRQYMKSLDKQLHDFQGGKASEFANREFFTNTYKTNILNEKSSGLMRDANNFSFPNTAFSKQFTTGSYQGFSKNFATPDNKNFSTDKNFDTTGRPFDSKVLDSPTDRDSGKSFASQNWNKPYYLAGKQYQGKEMTELGEYSGTVVLNNKADVKWEQDSLSSAQIKEILNKNK
jgi:hypothetical protein